MNFGDIAGKLKKMFGGKAGDLGLEAVLKGLTDLLGKAEGGDKTSIGGIIDILKKAVGNNADLGQIIKKCTSLAAQIKNGNMKEAVEALLKKIK